MRIRSPSSFHRYHTPPSFVTEALVKTVFILRHAKSSWDHPTLSDHDRPLAPRGRKAAPRMGAYMRREGLVPDRVICSSARRARETWELVAGELEGEIPVEVTEGIYHAAAADLVGLLQGLSARDSSVLLVGHNPTLEDLALALIATGDPRSLQRMESKFPTGALAILDFSAAGWREVREGRGHLRSFVRPKDVK